MALSGGAEAPDCHKSCSGCSGCSGYVSTCSGCSGSCHGGGHSLFGGHKSSCCGGGGHSLFGGHKSSCHGGSGCSGYSACSGYIGCSGSIGCSGYSGCYGSSGCTGYMGCAGGAMMPPPPPPKGEKLDMPKEKKDEKKKDEVSAPATIVLSLPADAKVSIDGVATSSTSASRTFLTPELLPAKEFVYVLSAEIVRDGQTLKVSEQVTVRAGEETRVQFGTEKFNALTVATK